MKMLPLNLLYESVEGYLVSSGHLHPSQKILGIVVGNAAFSLDETSLAWFNAMNAVTGRRLGSYAALMPTPEEVIELLRYEEEFNRTVEIIRRYGIRANTLTGRYYWTDCPYKSNTYVAIKKGSLERSIYSGQTSLYFRMCLRLR